MLRVECSILELKILIYYVCNLFVHFLGGFEQNIFQAVFTGHELCKEPFKQYYISQCNTSTIVQKQEAYCIVQAVIPCLLRIMLINTLALPVF